MQIKSYLLTILITLHIFLLVFPLPKTKVCFLVGGTLAKLSSNEEFNMDYIVFSPKSHEYDHNVLHGELVNGIKQLGYEESVIQYCDFETRYFPKNRQDILEYIFQLNKKKKYDWIFTPSTFDVHQDHFTVTSELLRVYKRLNVSIFGYELLLNNFSFDTSVFCRFNEQQMNAKLEAFDCFKSQMSRLHFSRQLFESNAKIRGAQMGSDYAEAFEAIRVII